MLACIALAKLATEDPSFRVTTDHETGQTIIAGMGELHLDIIVDRLRREFMVDANVGRPQVAYRETIRKPADGDGRFVRQSGGRGQFGHAKVKIEPAITAGKASGRIIRTTAASISATKSGGRVFRRHAQQRWRRAAPASGRCRAGSEPHFGARFC